MTIISPLSLWERVRVRAYQQILFTNLRVFSHALTPYPSPKRRGEDFGKIQL
jgi:hypothetical protein